MKIYRGPRTTDKWQITDSKSLEEWAAEWQPGKTLHFDGTIDKFGGRHTDLGVEIEPADIIHLHEALQRHISGRAGAADVMEAALHKIYLLVTRHKDQAPSLDTLLGDIQNIVCYAVREGLRDQKPTLDWIDYDSI